MLPLIATGQNLWRNLCYPNSFIFFFTKKIFLIGYYHYKLPQVAKIKFSLECLSFVVLNTRVMVKKIMFIVLTKLSMALLWKHHINSIEIQREKILNVILTSSKFSQKKLQGVIVITLENSSPSKVRPLALQTQKVVIKRTLGIIPSLSSESH